MSFPDAIGAALQQAWPPFVLVAALLTIGAVADAEGVFVGAARRLTRRGASPAATLSGLLALTALTSALLNLDTATAFLTPVLLYAARAAGADEAPFLYGAVLMSNAGSLFLPGSNLTNLLVLGHGTTSGAEFFATMLPAALAAVLVTGAILVAWAARTGPPPPAPASPAPAPAQAPPPAAAERLDHPSAPGRHDGATWAARGRAWPGIVAIAAAAILVVVLREPALPVLAVAVVTAAVALARRELSPQAVVAAVGPLSLAALLVLAVALGTLAREWDGPAELLAGAGAWGTAGLGALAAVTVNNLPGATLLSAQAVEHPYALLVGLNLGPNLAVTGSLSALIWWRTARRLGARPSALRFSRVGAPAALISGLVALALLTGLE